MTSAIRSTQSVHWWTYLIGYGPLHIPAIVTAGWLALNGTSPGEDDLTARWWGCEGFGFNPASIRAGSVPPTRWEARSMIRRPGIAIPDLTP